MSWNLVEMVTYWVHPLARISETKSNKLSGEDKEDRRILRALNSPAIILQLGGETGKIKEGSSETSGIKTIPVRWSVR